jgi:serine/threonine protein kinase
MSFKEGEQVGPYRIMEQLGRGGMATVFKAYHANLDRYVAIKVMHPAFMQDESFISRFQREAKVVAKMEHANIIPVYDFNEHDGRPYLVMKYIEGLTLKAKLNSTPLTAQEGVQIIEAVGKALTYAHNNGILHRDVKPSNVILTRDTPVYLADFGLARIASAGESTMSGDMMIGTPQYISPEQAMGKKDLDEGADIYSFGVLIYELVVGKVPFSSDTPFSIIHDHIYSPLPLPRTINPNVPESVERFLLKSLAKERADRFESVQEMVDVFKQSVSMEDLHENWLDSDSITTSINLLAGNPTNAANDETVIPDSTKKKIQKKKYKFKWWHIFPILLGLFFSLAILGSIFGGEGNTNPIAINQPDSNGRNTSNNDRPFDDEEPINFDSSYERINENPEDPMGYLELGGLFLDEQNTDAAYDAFWTGADYAEYKILMGDMFASRGFNFEAADMYIGAALEQEGRLQNHLSEKIRQTVFFATEDPRFRNLEIPNEDKFDNDIIESIEITANARFEIIHFRNFELALEIIDTRIEDNPRLQEMELVRAEAFIGLDEKQEAKSILQSIINGQTLSWIKIHARHLLESIN